MGRKLLLILIPIFVVFASPVQNFKSANLKLLEKFEKYFQFLKKEVSGDKVIYKNVKVVEQSQTLNAEKLTFYLNTPLLVGEVVNVSSTDGRSFYYAEKVDVVLEDGKLFSIARNAKWWDNQTELLFPEIINTLTWKENAFFYFGRTDFRFHEGKNYFNDTGELEVDAYLHPDEQTLYMKIRGGTQKLLTLETTLLVGNVSPELIEALKQKKPEGGKLNLRESDNKTSELFFSVVPKELKMEITLKPFLENLIENDKDTPKEIQNIERQLKKAKKGSLEESVLKAILHILKGESNTVVIKVKNKAGIGLGQIVGLFLMAAMSPDAEQAINLLKPYFDIKIVDF